MKNMEGDFENFRANLRREIKKVRQKSIIEKSGISRTVLHNIIRGNKAKHPFRENHMEEISKALDIPLSQLFLSPDQLTLKLQEDEFMKEIKECLDLMANIPEFKRAILTECDKLKRIFKDEVADVKKKDTQPTLKTNL